MTAQLQYTIQLRTVLIIFPLTGNRHSSDVVCWRRKGKTAMKKKNLHKLGLVKIKIILIVNFLKINN